MYTTFKYLSSIVLIICFSLTSCSSGSLNESSEEAKSWREDVFMEEVKPLYIKVASGETLHVKGPDGTLNLDPDTAVLLNEFLEEAPAGLRTEALNFVNALERRSQDNWYGSDLTTNLGLDKLEDMVLEDWDEARNFVDVLSNGDASLQLVPNADADAVWEALLRLRERHAFFVDAFPVKFSSYTPSTTLDQLTTECEVIQLEVEKYAVEVTRVDGPPEMANTLNRYVGGVETIVGRCADGFSTDDPLGELSDEWFDLVVAKVDAEIDLIALLDTYEKESN